MTRVVVSGLIHADGVAILKAQPGFSVEVAPNEPSDLFYELLPDADALLLRTQPVTRGHIDGAPGLKIVSRHGVGYDAVDLDALNARGIALAIVGDVNSRSVAEHTLMLMLACAKRALVSDRAVRAGNWAYRNRFEPVDLHGRTVLVWGFGRIGRLVGQFARAFGMTVLAHDPFVPAEAMREAGAEQVDDVDAALARADFVTLHAPKVGSEVLLGRDRLAAMKPDAFVINASRGGQVDEAALVDALDAGALAGAGLDVFDAEPPDVSKPLFAHERVILTPHSAGVSAESARRMSIVASQNIVDYFQGRLDPALVVNREAIGPDGLAQSP